MAEQRLDARVFQQRLAERLRAAADSGGESSKLGFLAGGRHWLTDLDQIFEVATVGRFSRAPWTQPWFLGAAGVRGVIYGCTDLGAFLGLGAAPVHDENTLLLAHPRFGARAALRIERALGLRNPADMHALEDAALETWELGRYRDQVGTEWTELGVGALVASPRFPQVGL